MATKKTVFDTVDSAWLAKYEKSYREDLDILTKVQAALKGIKTPSYFDIKTDYSDEIKIAKSLLTEVKEEQNKRAKKK